MIPVMVEFDYQNCISDTSCVDFQQHHEPIKAILERKLYS